MNRYYGNQVQWAEAQGTWPQGKRTAKENLQARQGLEALEGEMEAKHLWQRQTAYFTPGLLLL
jgi:hypothetical protein